MFHLKRIICTLPNLLLKRLDSPWFFNCSRWRWPGLAWRYFHKHCCLKHKDIAISFGRAQQWGQGFAAWSWENMMDIVITICDHKNRNPKVSAYSRFMLEDAPVLLLNWCRMRTLKLIEKQQVFHYNRHRDSVNLYTMSFPITNLVEPHFQV